MKNQGMLGLATVVALLTVYAVYDFKKSEKEVVQQQEQARLLNLNKDQINEIEILRRTDKFIAKRSTDGWRIEEPLKDWADNDGMEIFISSTVDEKSLDVVTEGDEIDWARYGLDQPLGQIVFKSTSGEVTSFDISEKRNFEQNVFLRRNKENRVLVGSATWAARLNKGVGEFRDKRLLRHKMASIERADIKLPKSRLTLELKEGRWILAGQPDKKLDQNKVRELLQAINDTTVADFIVEGREPRAAEKEKYFLNKPAAVIDLKLGEKAWKAVIGQTPNRLLFAWTSEPLFLNKLESGTLEKVFTTTEESLIEKPVNKDEVKNKAENKAENPAMKLNSQVLPKQETK